MPAERKHSVSRSFWRFFEIALFFLVSVLGYNFLAKTTSVNAKSKSREHSERGAPVERLCPGETVFAFFFPDMAPPACRKHCVTETHSNALSPGGIPAAIIFSSPKGRYALLEAQNPPSAAFSIPAFTPNLFQQKRVLII